MTNESSNETIRVFKFTSSKDNNEKPRYEYKAGDIFSITVTPDEPLRIVVGPTCNLTLTTITTEIFQAKDGSGLYYSNRHPKYAIPLFVKSSANHSASGLNLNCSGPNEFYLTAKLNSMFVFGSIDKKETQDNNNNNNNGGYSIDEKEEKTKEANNDVEPENKKLKLVKSLLASSKQNLLEKKQGSSLRFDQSEKSLSLEDLALDEAQDEEGGEEEEEEKKTDGDDDVMKKQSSTTSIGTKDSIKKKRQLASLAIKKKVKLADGSVGQDSKLTAATEMSSVFNSSTTTSIATISEDGITTTEPQTLSKKERKKLARQKSKELADALAIKNKYDQAMNSKSSIATDPPGKKDGSSIKSKVVPLTKERRLKSGVIVKDILIGTGTSLKPGRKVSICYEGRFADGSRKVFDKNMNKQKPLTFRQGTGSVIAGLEQGVEGMRVGGEREITIPPELGYGEKGSGDVIPPNSTLHFTVQVVGA